MSGTIRDGAPTRDVAAAAPEAAPSDSAHVLLASLREEANVESAAGAWARLLLSTNTGEAAVGLAVTNALLALNPEPAMPIDGVDWLLSRARGRDVAVIGAFPFVDRELRPIARRVWVFEREPGEGEFSEADAQAILPRADVVVITAGALANHTLDGLLRVTPPHAVRMLLGPSTPLASALFAFGFDALSGVHVADVDAVVQGVAAGAGFRRMSGLERVTLLRNAEPM